MRKVDAAVIQGAGDVGSGRLTGKILGHKYVNKYKKLLNN